MDNSLKFPDKKQLEKAIELFNNIDLAKVSYEKICSILLDYMGLIPKDSMELNKGHQIFRGRINKDKLFTSESEISYNPNLGTIKEFGRFNEPYQQLFYGYIVLPENEMESINQSIYSEIRGNNIIKNDAILLTIGKWVVIEDFEITTTLFEESNINDLKNKYPDKVYEIERIINFYSKQIKKPVNKNNHNQHKLTAAYANYLFSHVNKCYGIVYHSVETALKGRNVALLPEAIDSYCELKETRLYLVLEQVGLQPIFKEIMRANELGELCTSFKWKHYIDTL